MANFGAKDVQALRKATGAGMMDAKRALTENDGDAEAAAKWLREKGLSQSAKRSDRENAEGAVAVAQVGNAIAAVEMKSETDFVAKNPEFKAFVEELANKVAADGEGAVESFASRIDDMKVTLKENIELGRVVRFEAPEGHVLDTYLHIQSERGVNAVLVELDGGTPELAHDIALHIASSKPAYLNRDEVPAEVVAAERETIENITRNEGKPEAAMPKIVEGRLTGFYRDACLVEQKFVKDEKQSVTDVLGGASIVRFAQVVIGG